MSGHKYSKRFFILPLILVILFTSTLLAQTQPDEEPSFDLRLKARINAHGDEFNAVALSQDERRLIVGSEKGEVLVWDLVEGRVAQRFTQGSPIHAVVLLGDGRHAVAAGGQHFGERKFGLVRCWDLESGAFVDWPGLESSAILELAFDRDSGLVAASTQDGRLAVWDTAGRLVASWNTEKLLIGLATIGRRLYVAPVTMAESRALADDDEEMPANSITVYDIDDPAATPRELTPKEPKRIWWSLAASPDGKLLKAGYVDQDRHRQIALLDAASGAELSSFDGSAAVWFARDGLVLFEAESPSKLIRVKPGGAVSERKVWETGGWHSDGDPAGLGAAVASRNGKTVWSVFKKNAAIARWKAGAKRGRILTMTVGNVHAMDARSLPDGSEILLTGGDDGFARVWNLNGLSLLREFKVSFGVPQGVGVLEGGRRVLISYGGHQTPTEIVIADISTGEQRKILKLEQPFVRVHAAGGDFVYGLKSSVVLASASDGGTIREFMVGRPIGEFAVSANGRWLAIADAEGMLSLVEIATGRIARVSAEKMDSLTRLAVSGDGRWIYTTQFMAALSRWDTQNGRMEKLTGIRGQCRELRLSADEDLLLVGGNHRDMAIYEAKTGKKIAAFDTEAADFNVTNVWLRGSQLIFTTDAGVLLDGMLER